MFQKLKPVIWDPIAELFKSIIRKDYIQLLFLIIPILYLVNAVVIHFMYGDFYLGTVDPEYFHLFNGITIAAGNLSVEYTAHPGTPLEFLIAFSARMICLFQDEPLIKDFIDDPEKYIHAANLLQNITVALVLYFGSKKVVKYSQSFALGIFFQLIPFGDSTMLEISGRVIPETLMVVTLLFLFILLIKYIYTSDERYAFGPESVLWGAAIGFGIACKLSFTPVFILPLILLKSPVKSKISYIFFTIIAVCVFAYPIVFNWGVFKEWTFGMLSHSGMHGGGDKGVIDAGSIWPNFMYLFNRDKLLFIVMAGSILLLSLRFFLANVNKQVTSKISRAIIAVNITIVLNVLFTLKHFAYHYFMPFYAYKIFLILLALVFIRNIAIVAKSSRLKRSITLLLFVFTFLIVFIEAQKLGKTMAKIEERAESFRKNEQEFNSAIPENAPLIISAPYYGSPFPEFAKVEGFMMTFKVKDCFKKYLFESHPKSYFYVSYWDNFLFWEKQVDFEFILERCDKEFYLYLGEGKEQIENIVDERLYKVVDKQYVKKELVQSNKERGEKLIRYSLVSQQPLSMRIN